MSLFPISGWRCDAFYACVNILFIERPFSCFVRVDGTEKLFLTFNMMLYKNIKILKTAKYYMLEGQDYNKHEAFVHNIGLSKSAETLPYLFVIINK
jgi:hypothetical protein